MHDGRCFMKTAMTTSSSGHHTDQQAGLYKCFNTCCCPRPMLPTMIKSSWLSCMLCLIDMYQWSIWREFHICLLHLWLVRPCLWAAPNRLIWYLQGQEAIIQRRSCKVTRQTILYHESSYMYSHFETMYPQYSAIMKPFRPKPTGKKYN